MDISTLLSKARTSSFSCWWLNLVLPWSIPFNRPHGFKVHPKPDGGISVRVPNWRINRNHINGIHACALATAAEMCSGFSLLEQLDPRKYRLIMRSLHMEYHYQAKKDALASTHSLAADIEENVVHKLQHEDAVDFTSTVIVNDKSGKHLATGTVTWQVKEWTKVRTKR